MTPDERYMHRCLQLAALAGGKAAPNPLVGAVLVHEDRIIGEGFHRQYGGPHAEVHCIESVQPQDRAFIPSSTLYVSLEPCAHFGRTPPCADLVIRERIPKVVIGCRDPFPLVAGRGIEKMQAAGVAVESGVLEREGRELNRRFFTLHEQHRPYVVLKWARSADGFMGSTGDTRLLISNARTNRLVHRWRSEEMAILIGTRTALADDPELTTRLWPGRHPIRLVLDLELRLPAHLRLFQGGALTIIFNKHRHTLQDLKNVPVLEGGVHYYAITEEVSPVQQLLNALGAMGISSLLVEGGARLLQSFLDEGAWDEARVITNESLFAGGGLPAPNLGGFAPFRTESQLTDRIRFYHNPLHHPNP